MPRAGRSWWRGDSLALRVVAFLALALMPIGLIAIYQTREFQSEAMQRAELSLLALTERAATPEQQAIERAFGAAEAMGVVIDLFDDAETCSGYLRRFLEENDTYTFIGHIPPDGMMVCSSVDQVIDASQSARFEDMMASPRAIVSLSESPIFTSDPNIIVATPIFSDDVFRGYLTLSMPRDRLSAGSLFQITDSTRPLGLVTFNSRGELLTTRGDRERAIAMLPAGADLSEYDTFRTYAFTGQDGNGAERVYAVTPIVPGTVYALGTWDPPQAFQSVMGSPLTVGLFPVLMWLASLVVAYYAIHRLVIRHVRDLGRTMRRFATDRHVPTTTTARDMSFELREIEEEFLQMAAGIVQDEAQLENTVRERGILLKEVHHRVKNNLQLISSIMSMQMRRTADATTKSILSRLQDRVLGLATIHRSLYQSGDMGRVNAAQLVREIVGQQAIAATAGSDVRVRLDLDNIELLPDQAVPLSLLTAEAVANATNNLGRPADGPPWITVTLRDRGAEGGWIEIANSIAADPDTEDQTQSPRRGLGLGMNLIHAFAAQLGGQCDVRSDGDYRVSTAFAIRSQQHEPQDY